MVDMHCHVVGEYRESELKGLAKALKSGSPEAIRRAASLMADMVEPNRILVPIPSHTGRAGYTLQLARELSRLTGTQVADVLRCQPHPSSYELKRQGRILEAHEMGFQLTDSSIPSEKIMLIDNVVATGNTAKAALELLPGATVLALSNDSMAVGRLPNIIVHKQTRNMENHSTLKEEKKQGVILVTADGMTFAADLYRNSAQRERMWKDWIDVAIAKGLYKHVDFTVSDYPAKLSPFRGRTDKQIGFLLQEEQPERKTGALQAAFARRHKVDCYDAEAVSRFVNENRQAFQEFMAHQNPMTQRLNDLPLAERTAAEGVSRMQRIYQLKEHLAFDGGERIAGIDDVAWLFRHLQDRSIENTFAVLTKGDESIVLHLGIGNINNAIVEPHVIAETARRMGAEKVWFVHNHPSGDIVASKEDVNIHNILKEQLGNILQPSIIINTDTGKYGVFTEKCSGTHHWDWYTPDERSKKYVQIPVYAFDRILFHGKGKDRYKLSDANEIASFLSTQRLGVRDKYSLLAMDNKAHLNGYFHLPYSDLKQVPDRELMEHISSLAVHSKSQNVILISKDSGELIRRADEINGKLEKFSGGCIKLLDILQIGRNNFITRSWFNEKMETQERAEYRNPHMHIVAARESDDKVKMDNHPTVKQGFRR